MIFESVDKILDCDYRAVRSCRTVYLLYKVVLTFKSTDEILKYNIQMKTIHSTFLSYCLSCCKRLLYLLSLGIKSSCDHSNESY